MMINWKTDTDSRERVIKQAPYQMYLNYQRARKNPKIVHYAGFQKPWDECRCDGAEFFWKYAREITLYEELLIRLQRRLIPDVFHEPAQPIHENYDAHGLHIAGVEETVYIDGLFVKLINQVNRKFSKNSRRRELVKK